MEPFEDRNRAVFLMADPATVSVIRIGSGVYRVESEGRAETVYVAGPPEELWAFWNGQTFHGVTLSRPADSHRSAPGDEARSVTAPMPATVRKILVRPGAAVKKGESLILLEAMKMELALRAPFDGVVKGVHCAEGGLVQPERVLVDLE